jgi:formylglycine-generating enzyme required for sulfatase activity
MRVLSRIHVCGVAAWLFTLALMAAAGEAEKAQPPSDGKAEEVLVKDGFVNSLGIPFKAVAGTDVFFSVWLTRVKDFKIFAEETRLESVLWKSLPFKQGEDHPVVNVTWEETNAFCAWLTAKEHEKKVLPANMVYQLPSDLEWSAAVGLIGEIGETPKERSMKEPGIYPWGKEWPPPKGAGNFFGSEIKSGVEIKGYNDGFKFTSPVGSFPANRFGLFDISGNASVWTSDLLGDGPPFRVLRGGSYTYNGYVKHALLSSCRLWESPDSTNPGYGFRVVIALSREDESEKPK